VTRGLIWSFSTGVTGIPADRDRLGGDHLVAAGRTQPFKPAFREVYLVTPAELETRLYSNRFAAHVLAAGDKITDPTITSQLRAC
jgi:hypothetical protein